MKWAARPLTIEGSVRLMKAYCGAYPKRCSAALEHDKAPRLEVVVCRVNAEN